jgi:hypothetical protein
MFLVVSRATVFAETSIVEARPWTNSNDFAEVTLINPSPTFYFAIAAPRILAKRDAFKPEQYLLPRNILQEGMSNRNTGERRPDDNDVDLRGHLVE